MTAIPAPDFKSIFETVPGLYLVLLPDLTIAAVSDTYLQATMTERDAIVGRGLFEVFPDNPDDNEADGVLNLRTSLNYVLQHKLPHIMAIQKYDIRQPNGVFEIRYWSPLNTPVFNAQHQIVYIIHNVIDVTIRQRAEEKLKQSEKDYELLVNSVKDYAIFMLDTTGKVASWNTGAEIIKGYKAEEVIGKPMDIFYTAEEIERGEPQINLKMARENGHYETEGLRLRKNGSSFYANIVFTSLFDTEGNLYGYAKVTKDITEKRRAEDALSKLNEELELRVKERTAAIEKNEKSFRALIENNYDIISLVDESFKIIYRSPSAIRITGWTDEDVIGKDSTVNLHPDEADLAASTIQEVMLNPGKPVSCLFRSRHKNGHYLWMEGVITNLLHDEYIKAVVFNFRDITQRKELEDLLHKANVLARIGGWELDLVKGTVYWSDITREIHETGYDYVPDLTTGINFYKKGKGRILITKKVKEAIEYGKPWDEELQIITAKNNERWIRTIGETEFINGKCVRIYGSFQDIDQRKNAEQKIIKLNTELEDRVIRRTEQLRKTNEELEAFSYSVSHDLRAPLRAIIGYTAILEEDYGNKLDDEARRLTTVIKSNTVRMGNLIDDLLAFSRMSRHEMVKTSINNTEMVKEIISEMGIKNTQSGREIVVHSLPDTNGDSNMIRQVWVNFISNAVKYSSKTLHPHIEIGSYNHEGQIVFFIKDNGVGFDEKYKNKLFKVFHRLHNTDEFEGTGIGLAIVEKIISKHGGKVWAEAALNKGAAFYFSLPG